MRRGDLAARDVARRRVEAAAVPIGQMRVVDRARARVTREGTVAEGAAPRNVRTRPGVGDTVPELRTDNQTTVPFAVARTQYESAREREQAREDPDSGSASSSPRGRRPPADTGIRPATQAAPDVTGWGRRFASADQPSPQATPSPEAVRRRPEPARTEDGDREALRPWFRRLSRPRDDDRPASQPREEQASPRRRPRSEESPRAEPREMRAEPKRERPERVSTPPPPPPPPPPPREDGGRKQGAVRREKNRDQ